MTRTILKMPESERTLRAVSMCVGAESFKAGITKLVGDMFETMYAAKGIGLSAVQVGCLLRVIVIGIPDGTKVVMVNPVAETISDDKSKMNEGCLSIPGVIVEVERPTAIWAKYQNLAGEKVMMECNGLLARAVQHEIDHLGGVLIIDKGVVVP